MEICINSQLELKQDESPSDASKVQNLFTVKLTEKIEIPLKMPI